MVPRVELFQAGAGVVAFADPAFGLHRLRGIVDPVHSLAERVKDQALHPRAGVVDDHAHRAEPSPEQVRGFMPQHAVHVAMCLADVGMRIGKDPRAANRRPEGCSPVPLPDEIAEPPNI